MFMNDIILPECSANNNKTSADRDATTVQQGWVVAK
jgi:hypothetical protein